VKKHIDYFMRLRYDIHISSIPAIEGGGFEASIPVLGRYTFIGDGATIEEALADLERTKEENFKSLLKEGIEIPEPKDKQEEYSGRILVRLPKYLHKALVGQAADQGISLNQHISSLLASGFPVSELKKTLKEMCDLWSSVIYRYEFHEELHEPLAPAKGFAASYQRAA
jgi:antitoxin HicB